MEVSVFERINGVLKQFRKTANGLANMLNMTPSTVNRQLKGDQALSAKLVEGVLSAFPEVSAEWLLRGEGDMYKSSSPTSPDVQPSCPSEPVAPSISDSEWKAKYEELEKRYDQLLSMLCGRQSAQPLSSVG